MLTENISWISSCLWLMQGEVYAAIVKFLINYVLTLGHTYVCVIEELISWLLYNTNDSWTFFVSGKCGLTVTAITSHKIFLSLTEKYSTEKVQLQMVRLCTGCIKLICLLCKAFLHTVFHWIYFREAMLSQLNPKVLIPVTDVLGNQLVDTDRRYWLIVKLLWIFKIHNYLGSHMCRLVPVNVTTWIVLGFRSDSCHADSVYTNPSLYHALIFVASLYHEFYMHAYLNIDCKLSAGSRISADNGYFYSGKAECITVYKRVGGLKILLQFNIWVTVLCYQSHQMLVKVMTLVGCEACQSCGSHENGL